MRILITGPQGSGKTTQAHAIAQALNLCEVDSGDLVRARAQNDDEIGRKLKQALLSGQIADDNLVGNLVKAKLETAVCDNGVVMDGYPRQLSQLKFFDPLFDKVFYLELSDKEATKRALKRGRVDDTLELIGKRLKLFRLRTEPVLDYYQSLGKLIRLDGSKAVETITEEILKQL